MDFSQYIIDLNFSCVDDCISCKNFIYWLETSEILKKGSPNANLKNAFKSTSEYLLKSWKNKYSSEIKKCLVCRDNKKNLSLIIRDYSRKRLLNGSYKEVKFLVEYSFAEKLLRIKDGSEYSEWFSVNNFDLHNNPIFIFNWRDYKMNASINRSKNNDFLILLLKIEEKGYLYTYKAFWKLLNNIEDEKIIIFPSIKQVEKVKNGFWLWMKR